MDQILLAVILVLLTVVFFIIYKKSKSRRCDILLAGLCESGKTVLFSQLIHGKYVQTYTSMKENVADYRANNRKVRIVDLPGHERLRSKFVETYGNNAKAIVYVIDSVTVKKDVRDVAEYLFLLLCHSVQYSISNVLILCNKQDLADALEVDKIKDLLEKEINNVRFTKSKQLDTVYSNDRKIELVADTEGSFSFQSLSIKTEFEPCCAHGDKKNVNINSLKEWLQLVA